jgi:hypothetical protein
MSAVAIHTRLVQFFGTFAMRYLTVTKIARRTSWTENSPAGPERPNKLFDELTLDGLKKDLIACVRRIVDMTKIPPAIVVSILTNPLGFVSRKCRFVPHVLTEILLEDRLVRPIEFLPILVRAKQTNWHLILTGN